MPPTIRTDPAARTLHIESVLERNEDEKRREVEHLLRSRRVLVIVGSAHKPWLDAYLSMMSDVQIVDATRVLR